MSMRYLESQVYARLGHCIIDGIVGVVSTEGAVDLEIVIGHPGLVAKVEAGLQ